MTRTLNRIQRFLPHESVTSTEKARPRIRWKHSLLSLVLVIKKIHTHTQSKQNALSQGMSVKRIPSEIVRGKMNFLSLFIACLPR